MTRERDISSKINNARLEIKDRISELQQWNKHAQDIEILEIIDSLENVNQELGEALKKAANLEVKIENEKSVAKDFFWEYIERRELSLGMGREDDIIKTGRESGVIEGLIHGLQYEKHPHSILETGLRVIPQEVLDAPIVKRTVWIKSLDVETLTHNKKQLWIWEK